MKNNITRNVTLSSKEKVVKDFKKLQAIGTFAQVLLTSNRLIIYTRGIATNRGKKVRKKMMNEIDLKSIHRFEYYEETKKLPLLVRFFGLILFAGIAYLVYLYYSGGLTIPVYPYQSMYTDYGGLGLLMLISLILMFKSKSILYMKIISGSGMEEKTTLRLQANRYNEMAIKFLAGKIRTN
ncbi:MAG: hypothetical protein KKE16_01695 [Firmicutes bacterium]|nr:hypothetical protein [Bacillota bacterium]